MAHRAIPITLLAVALAAWPVHAQSAGGTASERLDAGEKAFNAGEWESAAGQFQGFLDDFSGLPGSAGAVEKVKPLLAVCLVRLGRFEAAEPLLEEVLKLSSLPARQRMDLVFFSGLSALRTGKPELARTRLGAVFTDTTVARDLRMESLVLGGMSYVMEENWDGAITFFRRYGGEIANYSAEAGARAKILLLHALMQEERWDEAATTAREVRSAFDEVRQVVTFAAMLVNLGAHFLDEGELHQAISLLGMVPEKAEIERLQQARLDESRLDLKAAEAGKNAIRASQVRTSIEEMERELTIFARNPQFDSAARLRLASAYFQLERTREACLILDQMVRQMEPDSLVESATASLMRGWMSLDRHLRAIRTADLYLERCANLPEKPNLPEVLFLKAQALEGLFRHQEATDAYLEVAAKFPTQEIASRAKFMAAYNVLQLEDYAKAGAMLERQMKELPKGAEMREHVIFWRAMAHYFAAEWEPCRALLETHLAEAKAGQVGQEYVDDADFRIAFSYFSEARYPDTIQRLEAFQRDHPSSEWLAEALLILGDSLAAEGELDDAERAYAAIGSEAPGFHDEGWLKRGNLFKVRSDLAGMKSLFESFLTHRPDSPRIAEGLQWLGWIARQQGDIEGARTIYWDAISRYGNAAARPGVEDIFIGLQGLYPAADRAVLEARLRDLITVAEEEKKNRLALRAGWALSRLDPAGSHGALVRLAPEIDASETAPVILADVGDALADTGDTENAVRIYDGLRKWWPRAPERDRAFAGLGFISVAQGDELKALEHFDRFERTSVMPRSAPDDHGVVLVQGELGGKVAMARADLLATRDPDQALAILLALQKSKVMPARTRGEALLKAARWHVNRQRHRESLPYFEQVYLLFNRFPDLVGAAYYERGQALEKLSMPDKAREVYSELVHRSDLASQDAARLAGSRARALGGVIPPKEPEGGLIPPPSPDGR